MPRGVRLALKEPAEAPEGEPHSRKMHARHRVGVGCVASAGSGSWEAAAPTQGRASPPLTLRLGQAPRARPPRGAGRLPCWPGWAEAR